MDICIIKQRDMQNQVTIPTGLLLNVSDNLQKAIFFICAVLCLTPFISPAFALLAGLIVAQLTGHPYLQLNHKATQLLLQVSVVGAWVRNGCS